MYVSSGSDGRVPARRIPLRQRWIVSHTEIQNLMAVSIQRQQNILIFLFCTYFVDYSNTHLPHHPSIVIRISGICRPCVLFGMLEL